MATLFIGIAVPLLTLRFVRLLEHPTLGSIMNVGRD
jgi:hypothetical protein